jgi:hypothetical protein
MKSVSVCSYDNLPGWVNRDLLSNNGSGAEWASYIIIIDGDYQTCYSDAMEPEDAVFSRDLKWSIRELKRAMSIV